MSISEMVLSPREFTNAPLRLNEEKKDKRDCKTPAVILAYFFSSSSFCYSMYVYEESSCTGHSGILQACFVVLFS